jgi:hypothetical protein
MNEASVDVLNLEPGLLSEFQLKQLLLSVIFLAL